MKRCIREDEIFDILKSCHDETCGDHFATKRIKFKILTTGFLLPALHKNSIKYARSYDRRQRMGRPTRMDEMPL